MTSGVAGYRMLGNRSTNELLALMKRDNEWMLDAKCRGKPYMDVLIHKLGKKYKDIEKTASAMCLGCPVMRECAADALLPIIYYVSQSDAVDSARGCAKRPSMAYVGGTVRAGVYVTERIGGKSWMEQMGRLMEIAGEDNVPDAVKAHAA